jgi:cyclic beta-1,2-glucan synthetase
MNSILLRAFNGAASPIPAVQLLSNGRYHVMITNAGGGCSRWKDIAVTRWREDGTRDNWGTFCYLRDVANGAFWSTTYQPILNPSAAYQAMFSEARAAFRCYEQGRDTHTEIAVSPEDDIEVRRIGITNRSGARKVIDLTSYAEVVLALAAADAGHPAFHNLFLQTEIIREQQAILCNRPSGAVDQAPLWMFHLIVPDESVLGDMSYETDRMRFIGRGNTLVNPQAMRDVAALSGSEGSVLDPIVAIQCRMTLDPEQSATVTIVSGIGETRDACVTLIEKYLDRHLTNCVFGWHVRTASRFCGSSI